MESSDCTSAYLIFLKSVIMCKWCVCCVGLIHTCTNCASTIVCLCVCVKPVPPCSWVPQCSSVLPTLIGSNGSLSSTTLQFMFLCVCVCFPIRFSRFNNSGSSLSSSSSVAFLHIKMNTASSLCTDTNPKVTDDVYLIIIYCSVFWSVTSSPSLT